MKSFIKTKHFQNFMNKKPQVKRFMMGVYDNDKQARTEFNRVAESVKAKDIFSQRAINITYNIVGWGFFGSFVLAGGHLFASAVIAYIIPLICIEMPAHVINFAMGSKRRMACDLVEEVANHYDSVDKDQKEQIRETVSSYGLDLCIKNDLYLK